jgi:hypothetical protein
LRSKSGNGELDRRLVRVLDIDPDLGVDLDAESLGPAGAELIAPVASVECAGGRGRWGPADPLRAAGAGRGALERLGAV